MRGTPKAMLLSALPLLTTACAAGLPDPTGVWNVTVHSEAMEDFGDQCAEGQEFQIIDDSFSYELYKEGAAIELRIDGEVFATGAYVDGCNIEYTSPAYLDEYQGAEVQWQVEGFATIDGAAGGCVTSDESLDWDGFETILVTRSDSEALPVGCTRDLDVTGVRAN